MTPAAPSLPGGPSAPGLPWARETRCHESCPCPAPICLPTLPTEAPGSCPSIQLQLQKLPKLPSAFFPGHWFCVPGPSLPVNSHPPGIPRLTSRPGSPAGPVKPGGPTGPGGPRSPDAPGAPCLPGSPWRDSDRDNECALERIPAQDPLGLPKERADRGRAWRVWSGREPQRVVVFLQDSVRSWTGPHSPEEGASVTHRWPRQAWESSLTALPR